MDQSNSPVESKAPETKPLDEVATAPPPPPPAGGGLFNAITFAVLAFLVGLLIYRVGLDGLVQALMVALGLGFVIFIHELGHFLAAKFCDVHVQTFSIGFGPALPGCSFTRGETTYKIAAIPLGGYVNMVGEEPEADEDENYPRSFKNKSVLARMLIISAGVIMNVIFGAIAFVIVYRYHGVDRPPAVVWHIEPGSPAWKADVRAGWQVVELDGNKDPWFDNLKIAVALSPGGRALPFRFKALPGAPTAPDEPIDLLPVRDANNLMPMIGVAPPERLTLLPKQTQKSHSIPALYSSPAAVARVLALGKDEVPVATIGPDSDKVNSLPEKDAWLELCERMKKAKNSAFTVRVRQAGGKTKDVELPATGFEFGDSVVAMTDPSTPDQPYNITPLPLDPGHPPAKQIASPFAYRKRLGELAGKPIVLRVRRAKKSAEDSTRDQADVLVPPAYHMTFGLRMQMGKVAEVREGSPAEKVGVTEGDVIKSARVRYASGSWETLSEQALDPVRLPFELARRIHADPKTDPSRYEVELTVTRKDGHNPQAKKVLDPMKWDDSRLLGEEGPGRPSAPMSIPQLGIAYWVNSIVVDVAKGSPAAEAGLQPGDEITHIQLRRGGKTPDEKDLPWSSLVEMASKRGKESVYDQSAHYFWLLQQVDFPIIKVKVRRTDKKAETLPDLVELVAGPDRSWPFLERGLLFTQDAHRQKADTLRQALGFGLDRTWQFIQMIYLNLSSLLSGRISPKSLGGPIEIASQAFSIAGEDPYIFLLYLGIISINLAVVNFLPIPVLDGGHMVFLIYEGLRGRPPSETVRIVATYMGLAFIVALMLFVMYLDLKRRELIPSWM